MIHWIFGVEKIRLGTTSLFKELRNQQHQIYIYTTSFRSPTKVKLMFYTYGIPVDRVINQRRHDDHLKENKTRSSKYPPAFNIDLHVDDSPGLLIEGERFNFKAVVISENDSSWATTILRSVEERRLSSTQYPLRSISPRIPFHYF